MNAKGILTFLASFLLKGICICQIVVGNFNSTIVCCSDFPLLPPYIDSFDIDADSHPEFWIQGYSGVDDYGFVALAYNDVELNRALELGESYPGDEWNFSGLGLPFTVQLSWGNQWLPNTGFKYLGFRRINQDADTTYGWVKIEFREDTLLQTQTLFISDFAYSIIPNVHLFAGQTDITSSGQEFAPVGAIWHFCEGYAWSNDIGTITYESMGDTIINNVPCRIIYKSHGSCCIEGGFHFLHQSNDSIFHYNPSTEAFDLIIRFDAEVGDSWLLHTNPDGNLMSDSANCIVDSIFYYHYSPTDSLKIMNVTLVSTAYDIIFGDTIYFTGTNQIIEKVGFRQALLLSDCIYFCDVNFERDIEDYADSFVGLIEFPDNHCESVLVENIKNEDDVKIYPNPARDIINIESTDFPNYQIELFSINGSQVFVPIGNQNLDVSALAPGLYYVRLRSGNRVINKAVSILK